MATPILTTTPALTATYNTGMAETFSWIPMEGAGRPLFARATYLANASDISVSLSANDLVINTDEVEDLLRAQLGQSGFDFIVGGQTANSGPYTTVQIVSACKISNITAINSSVGSLADFELPVNFVFNGPITSITLNYGAAIVYKL